MEVTSGFDGPYLSPFKTVVQQVEDKWIDYNGHMNVAYYTLAFDRAIDEFLEDILGIGPSFVKAANQGPYSLQANYNYLEELRLNENFFTLVYMVDADEKRIHLILEMVKTSCHSIVATCESLYINVDLELRKAAPYPSWAYNRIHAFKKSCREKPLPKQFQKGIKIR